MKVQFVKNFRDAQDRKKDKLGKSYLALSVGDFPKKRADEIIAKGFARKFEDKKESPTLETK